MSTRKVGSIGDSPSSTSRSMQTELGDQVGPKTMVSIVQAPFRVAPPYDDNAPLVSGFPVETNEQDDCSYNYRFKMKHGLPKPPQHVKLMRIAGPLSLEQEEGGPTFTPDQALPGSTSRNTNAHAHVIIETCDPVSDAEFIYFTVTLPTPILFGVTNMHGTGDTPIQFSEKHGRLASMVTTLQPGGLEIGSAAPSVSPCSSEQVHVFNDAGVVGGYAFNWLAAFCQPFKQIVVVRAICTLYDSVYFGAEFAMDSPEAHAVR